MDHRPAFRVGARVVDRTDTDVRLVVLEPDRGQADDVEVAARETTVAALNPEFPANDRVVGCVHVDWLERNAGDRWRAWDRDEFVDRLEAFAAEWRLQIPTYDYPESRLRRLSSERPGQSTIDDW